jgi:hypothetical protein
VRELDLGTVSGERKGGRGQAPETQNLRSHAQSAFEFDWEREPLEETGWVQVVLTRFVDHADEIVGRRIWVFHYWIQLSNLERGRITAIPEAHRETLCFHPTSRHR